MRTLDAEIGRGDHRTIVDIVPHDRKGSAALGAAGARLYEGPVLHAGAPGAGAPSDQARDAGIAVTIPDDVAHQTYVIYRLTRWGLAKRWLSRAGVKNPKPAEINSWWGPIVLDGNVEQTGIESIRDVCPWNLDEARETDVCVNALPGHLSAAIEEEYLKSGDRELKSARLGIDPSTMRRRLSAAHVLLLDLFNASAASLPLQVNYRGPGRPAKEEGTGQ
jgi:hypothetical protein